MSSYMGIDTQYLESDEYGVLTIHTPDGERSRWGWIEWGIERFPDRQKASPSEQEEAAKEDVAKEEAAKGEILSHKQAFSSKAPKGEGEEGDNKYTLLFTGDILINETLLHEGLIRDDFSFLFSAIRETLKEADFCAGNLEGTLGASDFSAYPFFKAPESLAIALKNAGFDAIATSNNHSLDYGLDGLEETLHLLRKNELLTFGSRLPGEAGNTESFLLYDLGGLTLGLSAFTYETKAESLKDPALPLQRSLNTRPIPLGAKACLDSFHIDFSQDKLVAEDLAAIRKRIETMREAGADYLIFFMHWGYEYRTEVQEHQLFYADLLADCGVDLILGMHPHVPGPLSLLPANNERGFCLCYYSLGNFIACQSEQIAGNDGLVNEGIIGKVMLSRDREGRIQVLEAAYIPTYIQKEGCGLAREKRCLAQVLPLEKALAELRTAGHKEDQDRILRWNKALERIVKTVGPPLFPERVQTK